jgi:hypothetical protein
MNPSHGAPFRGFRNAFIGRNDPYRPLAEYITELVGETGAP